MAGEKEGNRAGRVEIRHACATKYAQVCRRNGTASDESARTDDVPRTDRDAFSTLNIEAPFSTLLEPKQGNLDNQSPL